MTESVHIDHITIDKIYLSLNARNKVTLSVLRLDKIHPVISGNKYFKLKYYLQNAIEKKYKGVLTFGGAWSNHIVATACTASLNKLKSIGIIRGEKPAEFSDTLKKAQEYGMRLEFVSRNDYKNFRNDLSLIPEQFSNYLIIPEGGSGIMGINGAEEILQLINKNEFSHIACAFGTGTTFCGLVNASISRQIMIGIPVLKGMKDLEDQLADFFKDKQKISSCRFFYDYHFGGYAKYSDELIDFMNELYRQTGIPTDFVYTGKLFFAMNDLVEKKFFPQESNLLVIHSGGLQGNASLKKGTLIF